MFKEYSTIRVHAKPEVKMLPRFSLTTDIIGYKRCPRQYGYFVEKGFMPAHTLQIFYGTVIHEVLDRAHHHFKGYEDPKTKGKIPTDEEIEKYFNEVENSLKTRGIRAINRRLRKQALLILKRFNKIEGPYLYPLVIDTEHRVRGLRNSYIMEGVVDVLVSSDVNSEKSRNNPAEWEIWDYKGQKRPDDNSSDMQYYKYQMLVYSALYKIKNDCLPKSAKIYFLNELTNSTKKRPPTAILEIKITPEEIKKALKEFDKIAKQIIKSRDAGKWNPPSPKRVKEIVDTCVICDLRWSCPAWKTKPFPIPYP